VVVSVQPVVPPVKLPFVKYWAALAILISGGIRGLFQIPGQPEKIQAKIIKNITETFRNL